MTGTLEYGSYFTHYLEWDTILKSPGKHPILLLQYEENKKDPVACVKKIAIFLEIEISDQFAEDIAEKTNFTKLKAKRDEDGYALPDFYRKGKSRKRFIS